MKCAIKELLNIFVDKKKVLVLGDMLELGVNSRYEHENLFNDIDLNDIDLIYLYGEEIKVLYEKFSQLYPEKLLYFRDKSQLVQSLFELIKKTYGLVILFKSSNKIGLYEVVQDLIKEVK